MEKTETLKKTVEISIEAGYQLKEDAFEFLGKISEREDPTELISGLIDKMETAKEKTFFIDKKLLERFLGKKEEIEEDVTHRGDDAPKKYSELTEGKKIFNPYAKGIESDLKIIEDPGSELTSSGEIEDYLGYFRDRFRRLERLLRKRMDVKGVVSIEEALKSRANTKLKIIAMISRKSESKKRIFLTIEDLNSTATVLIPRNASRKLLEEVNSTLIDQVICLSVIKSRSNLLIAEKIITPDVARKSRRRASVPVYTVLTSDIHIGSIEFKEKALKRFILWLNGKYGNEKMKEIAGHVKYVLIAGDIVDGVGVYPNQIEELTVKEIYEQYKLAGEFIEKIPDYIEVVIIPGNHDASRKALPQPAISNKFLDTLERSRKIFSFGNPCFLSLHGVEVLMHHGRSLEDVISTIPGMDHRYPEKAMKILLQCRHIAPLYGGKTPLSPEKKDSLIIERVPDIYHSGHIHTLSYKKYRGVTMVNSGCWQGQTEYMRKHGFVPNPGKVPLVNLKTSEVTTISFI